MRVWSAFAVVGMVLAGCGEGPMVRERSSRKTKTAAREPAAGQDAQKEAAPAEAPLAEKAHPRMIVYTGRVELIVEDFDEAQAKLIGAIEAHKAYVSHSETTGEPHMPRAGKWTLRVPVAGFDALLDAVAGLGEARKKTKDSDDVTDRYFDAKAAATNLEASEKTLRQLYEKQQIAGKASEILEVGREVFRVRGEIDKLRGQMKRWESLTDFSTLEVSMRDRKGYVPPESPEYTTRVGRAWGASLEALVDTGKALFLAAVVVTPWLVVLGVLWLVVGLPLRRVYRRRVPTLPEATEEPPAE